jgi:hypothetical protein
VALFNVTILKLLKPEEILNLTPRPGLNSQFDRIPYQTQTPISLRNISFFQPLWRSTTATIRASVTVRPSCQNFCYEMELNMDKNFRRGWVLAAMEVIRQDRRRGRKEGGESLGGCWFASLHRPPFPH